MATSAVSSGKITFDIINQVREAVQNNNHELIQKIASMGPDFKKLVENFTQDFEIKEKSQKSVKLIETEKSEHGVGPVKVSNDKPVTKDIINEDTTDQKYMKAKLAAEHMVKLSKISFSRSEGINEKEANISGTLL